MRRANEEMSEPWYRNFWVWLLISIPGLTIVGCALTIFLAISNPDHLVEDYPPDDDPQAFEGR